MPSSMAITVRLPDAVLVPVVICLIPTFLEGKGICNELDVFVNEEPERIMSTRDVDAYTVIDAGIFVSEGVEVSSTLDSMGCACVTDLAGDVSDSSNAGHDISF
jgi:hypothetical protein